jgi:hypothetical protein
MNSSFDQNNINHYEGNGWSKYQIMVLQQLDDHSKVLQNMNKDINEMRQTMAVSETELKMWRAQITSVTQELEENVDYILYDEKGLNQKVVTIERELDIEEQANTKWKASMALYGSIAMFVVNAIVQLIVLYFKN